MTNTPIQVTTDLSTVLAKIDQKLETITKESAEFRTETKVAIEKVLGEINGLKIEVGNIKQDVKEIKGSQKAQIWYLIVLAFTAVIGIIGALAKVFLSPILKWREGVMFR
jgi:hypothetical protein